MKEILAKIGHFVAHVFCLFKLTISCKFGFGDKEESISDEHEDSSQKGVR